MGRQKRLKEFRRELKNIRRKDEKVEVAEEYAFFPAMESMLNEDMYPDQPEDFTEADVILKRLMPVLPSFSGKNFELWAIKIEGLLDSVDLWKFVQETDMNFENKSRRAIALFLIISALDENILSSILNEFGEVFDPKMFWHILETKYSIKWSQKDEIDDIVIKNNDCDESIIKTENMLVVDNKVICDSQEIPCDAKICEVKYDENYVSHEEWLCLMYEKQLINELLFDERICLSSYANQMQDDMFATTELIKEVEIMNQPTMKDEDLQNDVDIAENKIVENSIAAHEVVRDSMEFDRVVNDSIIVDEQKRVNSLFGEEVLHPATMVVADEEDYIIGHDSKYNGEFVKLGCILYKALSHGKRGEHELDYLGDAVLHPTLEQVANAKYTNKEKFKEVISKSRKEKLHHYLMARKVKLKLRLQINKYGPFTKKTKMKVLFSCIVVSLAET